MEEIDINDALEQCLDSMLARRLSILCGAGLSMSPPSNLPSAASIAADAHQKYNAIYGSTRTALPVDVEAQAEYFFQRKELATIYFKQFVDFHAFAGPPNLGHFAVADFLLIKGLQTGVSTNVDTLIETAGNEIYGQIGACVDGYAAARIPPEQSPLLKIHGCRQSDPDNMIWAPSQVNSEPNSTRIETSRIWLSQRLLDRDLLIVGFWSDWDYLHSVIEESIGEVSPSKVIVVNLANIEEFQEKAPGLFSLGERATETFKHVIVSGSEFLDSLRLLYSKSFIRQALYAGATEFQLANGQEAASSFFEVDTTDSHSLWRLRRDIEGCKPTQPAQMLSPPQESLFGTTILQLRAKGATLDGVHWVLNGSRIRVIRASGQSIERVQALHQTEVPQLTLPEFTIAVGAEITGLPQNYARAEIRPSITRGGSGRWLTRPQAIEELGL